jgi:hypothetical protein
MPWVPPIFTLTNGGQGAQRVVSLSRIKCRGFRTSGLSIPSKQGESFFESFQRTDDSQKRDDRTLANELFEHGEMNARAIDRELEGVTRWPEAGPVKDRRAAQGGTNESTLLPWTFFQKRQIV